MFRKALLGVAVVSAFMIVSDAFAGRLEQTTYYPAPDGQYSTLNSTEKTCFATTAGSNVYIGYSQASVTADAALPAASQVLQHVPAGDLSNSDLFLSGSIAQVVWNPIIAMGGAAPAFQNNWSNFDATATTYDTAGFFRDKNGIVHLKGVVKGGTTTGWPGRLIFTLPAGYVPMSREIHIAQNDSGAIATANGFVRLDIDRNGDVRIVDGDSAWLSLEGITFRASGY